MFIVFEGLDGSGSSTQAAILAENLRNIGKTVIQTKEPTTGTIGKLVREYLQGKYETSAQALQLLFAADRADHIYNLIQPNLRQEHMVISDRYFLSSIAFGALDSMTMYDWLKDLYEGFDFPDMVFLLKVPPAECIKRIEHRGTPKELFEKEEILKMVWENYERLAIEYDFVKIIDGTRSVEEISKEVLDIVVKRMVK